MSKSRNHSSKIVIAIGLSLWLCHPGFLMASSEADYKRALKEFAAEDYASAYKKAVASARKSKGSSQEKAYAIAAAAALELGREKTAKKIFKNLLAADPQLDLPDTINTPKVKRFLRSLKDDKRDNKSEEALSLYTPFGYNQYQQGKSFLALTFGGAQAAFLFLGYQQYQEASKADSDVMATYETAVKSGNEKNPAFLNYLHANEAYVRKARQDSQRYFLMAALAYGASVYEAVSTPSRRYSWNIVPMQDQEDSVLTSSSFAPAFALQLRWSMD